MAVIETTATLGSDFIKGLEPKLREIQNQVDQAYVQSFESALGVEANNMTSIFKKMTTDQARETFTGKSGLAYASLTAEGADYHSDSRSSTYLTQFNPKKFTNSITITEEDRDDRIVDRKLSEVRDLLVDMKMTRDQHAFDLFNEAFTAQASLSEHLTFYGDGTPMCSTIHPIKNTSSSNTTQSNANSSGIVLTEANLETGRTALRQQRDDRDLSSKIGGGRLVLLVPDDLEKTAVILAKSTKRATTANNDLNIYDGIITVISTKWLNANNGGSATQWFLIDSLYSPAIFMDRRAPTITVGINDDNKNITTYISSRYQIGNTDWRGIYGSKGDGSSYTS